MGYNIRQITNFSDEYAAAGTTQHVVYIGNTHSETKEYKILTNTLLTKSNLIKVLKLGYVCEPKGIDYPIYMRIEGDLRPYYLGKNGIYEFQPEDFEDINNPEEETKECIVYCSEVQIPTDIVFKLDYVYLT